MSQPSMPAQWVIRFRVTESKNLPLVTAFPPFLRNQISSRKDMLIIFTTKPSQNMGFKIALNNVNLVIILSASLIIEMTKSWL